MKVKTIEIESLLVMFVIAMGEAVNGVFIYTPKLPNCFSTNVNINGFVGDFSHFGVDDEGDLTFWFTNDEEQIATYFTINEVKLFAPYLYVSIITHVFDMIENLEE